MGTLDKIIDHGGRTIVFSGGEPMLRSDFAQCVQYARNWFDGSLGLMTNGTLIDKKNVALLSDCFENIDISIDGIDESTCSIIRGKGVFQKVLDAIDLLQAHGMYNITLSMVLTPLNTIYLDEFYTLNECLGTKAIPRRFVMDKRAQQNSDIWSLDQEQRYSLNEFVEDRVERQKSNMDVSLCTCSGAFSQIAIASDGEIFPCPLFSSEKSFSLGNILDIEDLRTYFGCADWRHNDGFTRYNMYRPENHKKCGNCDVSVFCWSCPYELYIMEQDADVFMNYCEKKGFHLREKVWNRRVAL